MVTDVLGLAGTMYGTSLALDPGTRSAGSPPQPYRPTKGSYMLPPASATSAYYPKRLGFKDVSNKYQIGQARATQALSRAEQERMIQRLMGAKSYAGAVADLQQQAAAQQALGAQSLATRSPAAQRAVAMGHAGQQSQIGTQAAKAAASEQIGKFRTAAQSYGAMRKGDLQRLAAEMQLEKTREQHKAAIDALALKYKKLGLDERKAQLQASMDYQKMQAQLKAQWNKMQWERQKVP